MTWEDLKFDLAAAGPTTLKCQDGGRINVTGKLTNACIGGKISVHTNGPDGQCTVETIIVPAG